MGSRAENKEVKIIGVSKLSPELGKVVNDLDSRMPEGSSVVVQVSSPSDDYFLRYGWLISRVLQDSPVISECFPLQKKTRKSGGHKSLLVRSPNTWLAGDFDDQKPPTLRYGLFTRIEGCYSAGEVSHALGLAKRYGDLHHNLNVAELTGRVSGSVSVILERRYLEECQLVHFQPALVEDLKLLNTLVDYPLGDLRFYVARGEAFLKAYAGLLKDYSIPTNLSTHKLDTE